MTVKKTKKYIRYREGTYTIDIYKSDYMVIKHQCPKSTKKDHCYDHILPTEMESGRCGHCNTLDVPENLQALYWLYGSRRGN